MRMPRHLTAALLLALQVGCNERAPSSNYACTTCDGGLAHDLVVTAIEVSIAPPLDDAGVSGTALVVLRDTSSGNIPIADVRPRFAALAPGLEATTTSTSLERTDARGLIPVKFKAACFPFGLLVQTPDGRSNVAAIAPDGGAERYPCIRDAGMPDVSDASAGDGGS